ncbi:hypothetical protein NFI96_018257 [Prochilodus magdalenae]|nr:hypothetical protein NFI96_018257 [Prochilodus magdalenae]
MNSTHITKFKHLILFNLLAEDALLINVVHKRDPFRYSQVLTADLFSAEEHRERTFRVCLQQCDKTPRPKLRASDHQVETLYVSKQASPEAGNRKSGARDYRSARTTRRESRDCCVFVFTETWLSDRVLDATIQLDGLASFRADRDSALCDHHHTPQPEAVDDCRGACSAEGSRPIREAKRAHGQSIHSHFRDSGDTRRMWQGIQAITNYRTTPPACDSDASLPDALNHYYARFETQNSVAVRKTSPPSDDQVLCLTAADVRKSRVDPRKAAGPDNIPARVLRECADQLTDVFTDIFNISLSSATVPTSLKATTIIPVPKKSSVSCLNGYRPVALTPIIMKCFERLVMRHIKTLLPLSLGPLQFAYHPNHSMDDAISTTLHLALTHLDNRDTYV